MSTAVMTRPLATAAVVDLELARIVRRATAAGWTTCDVCTWPVDPAAVVAGRRPRHPGCLCGVCDAPLTDVEAGVLFHPLCDPDAVLLRSARRGRLVLVAGGGG